MSLKLEDFIYGWNSQHRKIYFATSYLPITERPTSVAIRYAAARYQGFYSTDAWNNLKDVVETMSHGTMYVVTSEHLFEKGVIDIVVASANHNYHPRLVIDVLRWIGEEFFPTSNQLEPDV